MPIGQDKDGNIAIVGYEKETESTVIENHFHDVIAELSADVSWDCQTFIDLVQERQEEWQAFTRELLTNEELREAVREQIKAHWALCETTKRTYAALKTVLGKRNSPVLENLNLSRLTE